MGDIVGIFGIVALSSGNYVAVSSYWDNGGIADAGAVTFGNGFGGTTGQISAGNSVIGSTQGDLLGEGGTVIALSDANYAIASPMWDAPGIPDAGAVTWGNGVTGTVGAISAGNSLIGSTAGDRIGNFYRPVPLPAGRYAIGSSLWDASGTVDARAMTLAKAGGITTGAITSSNSVEGPILSTSITSVAWDPIRERLAVGRGTRVSFISYDTIMFDRFE